MSNWLQLRIPDCRITSNETAQTIRKTLKVGSGGNSAESADVDHDPKKELLLRLPAIMPVVDTLKSEALVKMRANKQQ